VTENHIPMIRGIEVIAIKHEGKDLYLLRDPLGIAREQMVLPPASLALLQFFDGRHSVLDIQAKIKEATGQEVPVDQIQEFVEKMDDALMLDSPRFQTHRQQMIVDYRALPERPAQFAGEAYATDASALYAEIDACYRTQGAPGLPEVPARQMPAAVVAPHIDPTRGAPVYAQAYAPLWGCEPERVVVLGVCHAGGNQPFVLTTKDFETPFGAARTDTDLVKRLTEKISWDPLLEEDLHLLEHSIEFQNIFIHHAMTRGGTEQLAHETLYVPILCAFPWQTFLEIHEAQEILKRTREFIHALSDLLQEDEKTTVLVAGIDLAHMGHRFGDEKPLSNDDLRKLQNRDMNSLTCLARGDRDAFVEEIVREEDQRRICGFAPLYTMLSLLPDATGHVQGYQQAIDRHATEDQMESEGDVNAKPADSSDEMDDDGAPRSVVSFTAMTYYGTETDEE
jgi:MEMO1 family protein